MVYTDNETPEQYSDQNPTKKFPNNMMKPAKKIHAVDLFCGVGGLTHGIADAGIKVKAGVDNDVSCEYAYTVNNKSKFINKDIRDIKYADIVAYYKGADIRVLVGCAPCQPFSAHTRKNKRQNEDDCALVLEFLRIIKEGKPDIVSMENVPGLVKHPIFSLFLKALKRQGYKSYYKVISCLDFNIPQNRKRLVLLASKLGDISLLPPQSKERVSIDLIKRLPKIKHGQKCPKDHIHTALRLSNINVERIRQSKPGGSWKDWDAGIKCKCHASSYYPAPYGRMKWGDASPTITTQFCYYSTGRFGHPSQNRTISLREGALLQTFPEDYDFVAKGESFQVRAVAKHIGNAVPVDLGRYIGRSIVKHVYTNKP